MRRKRRPEKEEIHCPDDACRFDGGIYEVPSPADVHLPSDKWGSRVPDEQLMRCNHCGMLWFQHSSGRQRRLGKYGGLGGETFRELGD